MICKKCGKNSVNIFKIEGDYIDRDLYLRILNSITATCDNCGAEGYLLDIVKTNKDIEREFILNITNIKEER